MNPTSRIMDFRLTSSSEAKPEEFGKLPEAIAWWIFIILSKGGRELPCVDWRFSIFLPTSKLQIAKPSEAESNTSDPEKRTGPGPSIDYRRVTK